MYNFSVRSIQIKCIYINRLEQLEQIRIRLLVHEGNIAMNEF